jgi:hypothetical protein
MPQAKVKAVFSGMLRRPTVLSGPASLFAQACIPAGPRDAKKPA